MVNLFAIARHEFVIQGNAIQYNCGATKIEKRINCCFQMKWSFNLRVEYIAIWAQKQSLLDMIP